MSGVEGKRLRRQELRSSEDERRMFDPVGMMSPMQTSSSSGRSAGALKSVVSGGSLARRCQLLCDPKLDVLGRRTHLPEEPERTPLERHPEGDFQTEGSSRTDSSSLWSSTSTSRS